MDLRARPEKEAEKAADKRFVRHHQERRILMPDAHFIPRAPRRGVRSESVAQNNILLYVEDAVCNVRRLYSATIRARKNHRGIHAGFGRNTQDDIELRDPIRRERSITVDAASGAVLGNRVSKQIDGQRITPDR